jgi:hypothetical protein
MVDELRTDAIDVPDDGWAPHVRIGGYTALLIIAAGSVLVGWVLIGGFGIVLGLIADVAGIAWLRRRYGAVVPPDVPAAGLLLLLMAAIVLAGIAYLVNYA